MEYCRQVRSFTYLYYFPHVIVIVYLISVQVFPMVFVLMTRKTAESYTHIFQYIDKEVCSLRASRYMTDFETAMRNGLKQIYPDAEFHTCWFHLCQAARRHVAKKNDLATLIRQNQTARTLYKKLLALPLLPHEYINDTFTILKGEILTRFRVFDSFLQFYEKQWIQKVKPPFSSDLICVCAAK